jgi:hypothetical protein
VPHYGLGDFEEIMLLAIADIGGESCAAMLRTR